MFKTLNSVERIFIILLGFVLVLNALKPLFDYFLQVDNRDVTIAQAFVMAVFFISAMWRMKATFSRTEFLFVLYLLMRWLAEIVANGSGIVQPSVPLVKMLILVCGYKYLVEFRHTERFHRDIFWLLMFYALFTVVIAGLHQSDTYLGTIYAQYGGNILSGNHLGFVRSSGGLGGTVIDYAVFLIYVLLMVVFCKESKRVKTWSVLLLLVGAYYAFSRVLFLVLLILLLMQVLTKLRKNILVYLPLLLSLIIFFIVYFPTGSLIDDYGEMRGSSDSNRVGSWVELYDKLNGLYFIVGASMGQNTGLPLGGVGKVTGDGHLQGMLYDVGIIGLCLYLTLLYNYAKNIFIKRYDLFFFLLVLVAVYVINSGAEKIFNAIVLVLILGVINKNNSVILPKN